MEEAYCQRSRRRQEVTCEKEEEDPSTSLHPPTHPPTHPPAHLPTEPPPARGRLREGGGRPQYINSPTHPPTCPGFTYQLFSLRTPIIHPPAYSPTHTPTHPPHPPTHHPPTGKKKKIKAVTTYESCAHTSSDDMSVRPLTHPPTHPPHPPIESTAAHSNRLVLLYPTHPPTPAAHSNRLLLLYPTHAPTHPPTH